MAGVHAGEARVDGLRLAYREQGDGPPLLLLHGGMSDSREWHRQLDALSDRWRVVAWDAPGCGGSDDAPPDWLIDDFAGAVAGLAAALGVSRAHLCGVSFGAGLALAVAARAPELVRSLVLVSGYAGWAGSLPAEEVQERLRFALAAAQDPPEPRLEDGRHFTGPDPSQEVLQELLEIARDARPSTYAVLGRAFATADLRPVLPQLQVPVLVVCGEADTRCPPAVSEALAAAIPGATMIALPGVGHVLHQEAPEVLERVLRPFLAAAEGADARR